MSVRCGDAGISFDNFVAEAQGMKVAVLEIHLDHARAALQQTQAELEAAKAEQQKALFETNPGKDVALVWTGECWLRMIKPTVSLDTPSKYYVCNDAVPFSPIHSITIKSNFAYTGYIPKPAPKPALTQTEISALLGRHFGHLDATERERIAALLSVTGPASASAEGCAAEGR